MNGLSDCYYKCYFDDKLIYTSSVEYKTLNPKWNDKCDTFVQSDNNRAIHEIRVDVWDKDRLSRDDYIGSFSLQADLLNQTKFIINGQWIDLLNKKRDKVGTIHVDICLKLEN
jgi:Ca2+-dependent lipid-binding protein